MIIPYDKRDGKIWYNSELVNWSDVKLHVLSHGLHYASCVFEGERVYDGEIFKLEEHTSRFFHSAKRMGFKIPYSCLLYTSPSPRDSSPSRMPSSA